MKKYLTKKEFTETLERRHGKKLQRKFTDAAVAVCGLGGLGSNIAISLARAGIGRLILIDFDRVDLSNLHRQQYFVSQLGMYKTEALSDTLRNITPFIKVATYNERVTEDNLVCLLQDADIICEAFDRAEEKAMLCEGVMTHFPEKYVVAASGMSGMESGNSIQTRRISRRFYLCGDGVSDVNKTIGLVATRVMLCAAHQAHTVLRILTEEFGA